MNIKYTSAGHRISRNSLDDDPFLRLILECRSPLSRSKGRLKALLDEHPGIADTEGLDGKAAIFFAIESHSDEAVRLLVENGADLKKQFRGMSPLEYAVYTLYSQGSLQDRDEPILKIVCFLTKKTCETVKNKESCDTM